MNSYSQQSDEEDVNLFWEKRNDSATNQVYYYNAKTFESSWEDPRTCNSTAPNVSTQDNLAETVPQKPIPEVSATPSVSDKTDLAEGVVREDNTGVGTATKTESTKKVSTAKRATTKVKASLNSDKSDSVESIANQWEQRLLHTGHKIFVNLVTKDVSWTDPTKHKVLPQKPKRQYTSRNKKTTDADSKPTSSESKEALPSAANSTNPISAMSSSSSSTANAVDVTEPPNKRSRHNETTSNDVMTSSYKPPESGAAVDMKMIATSTRPYPKIIPRLSPAPEGTTMWDRRDIQVNNFLAETYRSGSIIDRNGVKQKFKDITNPLQGRHIYNLIRENGFTHTLEVGLAMGASASWTTQAHHDNGLHGKHIAIDPNQHAQYDAMGLYLVEQCGNGEHLELMEMTSYRALPKLFEDVLHGKRPKFDLIYIDGWHTFDYTLVDFFYADLLLNVHGVIVLDDIKHLPVRRCFDYIVKNYPHYRLVEKTPVFDISSTEMSSQATFVKIGIDQRTWNAHTDF